MYDAHFLGRRDLSWAQAGWRCMCVGVCVCTDEGDEKVCVISNGWNVVLSWQGPIEGKWIVSLCSLCFSFYLRHPLFSLHQRSSVFAVGPHGFPFWASDVFQSAALCFVHRPPSVALGSTDHCKLTNLSRNWLTVAALFACIFVAAIRWRNLVAESVALTADNHLCGLKWTYRGPVHIHRLAGKWDGITD